MVYLTGDTHGDFHKIVDFVERIGVTKDDLIVILGDAGFNFFGNVRDIVSKELVNNLGVPVFCIHGNHEMRPRHIGTYHLVPFAGAMAYQEPEYKNLYFGLDGAVYNLQRTRCLVMGGAYSVDKYARLYRYLSFVVSNGQDQPFCTVDEAFHLAPKVASFIKTNPSKPGKKDYFDAICNRLQDEIHWWSDEQPSGHDLSAAAQLLSSANANSSVDCILSHTCPADYVPIEAFLGGINQALVDDSTEQALQELKNIKPNITWYCGHCHIDKKRDNVRFLMDDFLSLDGKHYRSDFGHSACHNQV